MPENEVRKASDSETVGLARTLALAFHADPVFSWVVPDPERRAGALASGFDLFLRRLWLELGESYTAGECDGAAIWHPPGRWKVTLGEQLRLFPGFARAWGRSTPRALAALTALERGHPSEPHYYLAVMGVQPDRQGRGLGSKLMHPVLTRCDRDGVGAYLEASTSRNRSLYERHGFVTTSEDTVGRGSPPIWRMWREPATGPPSSGPAA
jgi:GNAT superfamily N-acetyltransferase